MPETQWDPADYLMAVDDFRVGVIFIAKGNYMRRDHPLAARLYRENPDWPLIPLGRSDND
jgi:hypothetical protein